MHTKNSVLTRSCLFYHSIIESMRTTSMDAWRVIESYFQDHKYPFTKHHIDSFREFIRTYIPDTIKTYNPITMIKYTDAKELQLQVEVFVGGEDSSRIYIDRPIMHDSTGTQMLLTPQEARLRNLTYQTNIYADLVVKFTQEEGAEPTTKLFERVLLGAIPIMVHSDACMLHGQGTPVLREFHEDMYDAGGYFIIDGKEKVIVSQERITTNRLFISRIDDPNFDIKAFIRCTAPSGEASLIPRTIEFKIVKNPDLMFIPDVKQDLRPSKGAMLVSLPSIEGQIPIAVLFRALGVETDKAIVDHILGDTTEPSFFNFIRPLITHNAGVYTQEAAFEYLRNRVYYKSTDHVKNLLVSDVLPNVTGDFANKARYLGYLIQQIMRVALQLDPESDRDGYVFKRVDISGFLIAQLFQETYNKLRKSCRDMLDREYYYGPWKNTGDIEDLVRKENLHRLFNPALMTDTFTRSFKGMWGPQDQDPDQALVQDLARISYIGTMSHVRRVNLPLDRSIKVTSPHRLHSQQWGVMCPFESPDGASIGYLKNFALLTHITFGTDVDGIHKAVHELGAVHIRQMPPATSASSDIVRLFINGDWYGVVLDPPKFVKNFRILRRNGLINVFISISWDIAHNEIRIQTESGRPCRPLIIVEDGFPRLTHEHRSLSWFDLILGGLLPENQRNEGAYYKGEYTSPFTLPDYRSLTSIDEICAKLVTSQAVIEFLDIEEENTRYIAMNTENITHFHTHLEIHPATIFSVVTNNIPFANHNFAPRNCFYGSQSKQAIGVYTTNFTRRFDTMGYVQHYPQKPLVTTRISHYTGNDRMPNGFNAIVAVATHSGYNQEDALIINKSAIDRGLFQITAYKSMSASEKITDETESLVFANPAKMIENGESVHGIRNANYKLLDDHGFVKEESYIPRGQEACVIGCVRVKKRLVEKRSGVSREQVVETTYHDASLVTDVHHYGKIDKVYVGHKGVGDNQRIAKVRFRKIRRPELGDKCVSRCAQKGVIGMILPAENMPFSKDGIIPDLIINPHAFPSRMTVAHLIECVFAKLCALEGMLGDGTVFVPFDKDQMFEKLETHGFDKHGNEILYNGRTGEMIPTEIFFGPTFYMRLKHMVTDKIHARGTGPKVQLTQQPTAGRSKQGGLRIGEMERDVIIGHGMANFIQESMMEKADKYEWAVCKQCGTIAKYAPSRKIFECHGCASQELSVVRTPYAFKLLIQELEGMGIQMRLSSEPFDSPYSTDDEDEETTPKSGGTPANLPFNPLTDHAREEEEEEEEDNESEVKLPQNDEDDEDHEDEDEQVNSIIDADAELNTNDIDITSDVDEPGVLKEDMWTAPQEDADPIEESEIEPIDVSEDKDQPQSDPEDQSQPEKEQDEYGGGEIKVINIDTSSARAQQRSKSNEVEEEMDEFFTEP